jgi:2-polyprenyl-3-methyl-5-hydroxy-6-metoxy-1,4-benzoquinol methylase
MPGYQVKIETLSVGGVDLQIRSLLDRQQFSDPHGDAERAGISSTDWPLFGIVWPSSHVLADAMVHVEVKGKRVLEVGCGLALASLVVQRRDGDITASDRHPMAGTFLQDNLQRNGLAPLRFVASDWGATTDTLGRFDMIIGSDVLYERQQPEVLSRFIEAHSHATMEVLIADPDRGNRSAFNRHMDVLGFDRSETKVGRLSGGADYKGRLLSYRRIAASATL